MAAQGTKELKPITNKQIIEKILTGTKNPLSELDKKMLFEYRARKDHK